MLQDSGYWGCPPQSQRQSVEVMLTRLEGKIAGGYKRKKLSLNATASDVDDTSQSAESHDMEYEETPGEQLLYDTKLWRDLLIALCVWINILQSVRKLLGNTVLLLL